MKENIVQNRIVLRYVYAMLGVVVISASMLIVTLYSAERSDDKARDRVDQYHLRSLTLTTQLDDSMHTLGHLVEDSLSADRSVEPGIGGTLPARIGFAGILYSTRSIMTRLRELEQQQGEATSMLTLDRIFDRFERVENMLGESGPTESMVDLIAVLTLNVEQLHRLHSISTEKTLADLDSEQSRHTPVLGTLGAIIGASLLLFWYLIRLLRAALVRQSKTETALASSVERVHHMQKLEALGQLVGGVAHDFNNLLTAILGQASLLRARSPGDDRSRASLGQIQQAAEQAASLTQQLLAFSRRQRIDPRVLDLNALIRKMQPMLRRLIGEDLDLVLDCADDLYAVELDPGQTEQVLMNLVVNSRDAMPLGGVISIRTENSDVGAPDSGPAGMPGGRYARLTVADNGVGMGTGTLERLFEPFFTTKPKGRGTGLGLSMVHGIVTGAGGQIFVDSTPGEGTRFDIYLPRSNRKPGALPADPEPSPAGTGSETILIVEDEGQIRDFLETGLGDLGYNVLTASGGAAGLEICAGERGAIDVIVSDVIMSGMNGPDFMRSALKMAPDAVAIYMSGYTDDIVLKRGVTGVEIPLLRKPFELGELAQLIRNGLDTGGHLLESKAG